MSKVVICHDLYNFASDFTSEELHRRHNINIRKMRIEISYVDTNPVKIPTAASFVDGCAGNYAHWISEVLPRIAIFCSNENYLNVPIIINDGLHSNIMDSLAAIIGSEREVILLPIGRAIQVSRLIATSVTGYIPFEIREGYGGWRHHGVFNPTALNLVQKKALFMSESLPNQNWPEKIYLRRNSSVRKVTNFSELERCLLLQGFVCIEPEKLTFLEQVKLFSNAKVIISPTGAALANAIFCKPGTKIGILMSMHENMIYGYWQSMLAGFNLNITHLLGDIVGDSNLDLHSDFFLDRDILEYYLKYNK
jgi:capsular polysaccharide biosynthesis protein